MICGLVRWLISTEEDGGRPLPAFALRHVARCGKCREFRSFTAALADRMSGEAAPAVQPETVSAVRQPAVIFAWAAAAAGLVCLAFVLTEKPGLHEKDAAPVAVARADGGYLDLASLVPVDVDRLSEVAMNTVSDVQLSREVERLALDAASAVRCFGDVLGLP